jgi:hypothetical protein
MEWWIYPDAMRHVYLAGCNMVSVIENCYWTKRRKEKSIYVVHEFLIPQQATSTIHYSLLCS